MAIRNNYLKAIKHIHNHLIKYLFFLRSTDLIDVQVRNYPEPPLLQEITLIQVFF